MSPGPDSNMTRVVLRPGESDKIKENMRIIGKNLMEVSRILPSDSKRTATDLLPGIEKLFGHLIEGKPIDVGKAKEFAGHVFKTFRELFITVLTKSSGSAITRSINLQKISNTHNKFSEINIIITNHRENIKGPKKLVDEIFLIFRGISNKIYDYPDRPISLIYSDLCDYDIRLYGMLDRLSIALANSSIRVTDSDKIISAIFMRFRGYSDILHELYNRSSDPIHSTSREIQDHIDSASFLLDKISRELPEDPKPSTGDTRPKPPDAGSSIPNPPPPSPSPSTDNSDNSPTPPSPPPQPKPPSTGSSSSSDTNPKPPTNPSTPSAGNTGSTPKPPNPSTPSSGGNSNPSIGGSASGSDTRPKPPTPPNTSTDGTAPKPPTPSTGTNNPGSPSTPPKPPSTGTSPNTNTGGSNNNNNNNQPTPPNPKPPTPSAPNPGGASNPSTPRPSAPSTGSNNPASPSNPKPPSTGSNPTPPPTPPSSGTSNHNTGSISNQPTPPNPKPSVPPSSGGNSNPNTGSTGNPSTPKPPVPPIPKPPSPVNPPAPNPPPPSSDNSSNANPLPRLTLPEGLDISVHRGSKITEEFISKLKVALDKLEEFERHNYHLDDSKAGQCVTTNSCIQCNNSCSQCDFTIQCNNACLQCTNACTQCANTNRQCSNACSQCQNSCSECRNTYNCS